MTKMLIAVVLCLGVSNAFAKTLLGTADLNADGRAESIYKDGYYLSLESGTKVQRYNMGPTWNPVLGVADIKKSIADMDGKAGSEIAINVGSHIRVVNYTDKSVKDYSVSSAPWAVVPGGVADLDGDAGAELVAITGSYVRLISPSKTGTRAIKEYWISDGNWAVVNGGIIDLDNVAGAEVVAIHENNVAIITFAKTSNQQKEYVVAEGAGKWAVLPAGIRDLDGELGREIPMQVGSYLKVLYPVKGRVKSFFVSSGSWSVTGYANVDKYDGEEVLIKLANGSTKTISARSIGIPVPGQ